MKIYSQILKSFIAALFIGAAVCAQAQTINPMPKVSDDWSYSGNISAWAPATWVTDTIGNRSITSDSSISQNVNGAGPMAMFTLEAHKGNWGVMGDLVYWQSTGSGSSVHTLRGKDNYFYAGYNATMKQTMFTAAATYTALNTSSVYLDGLLGARYISSTTSVVDVKQLDLNGSVVASHAGNPSRVNQTTDPVIGFKGRARIYDTSWFIPFYADAGKGSGSNNGTWQALLGIGDAFSWGDVTLAYRAMGFHLKDNAGSTNWTNGGPQISATINF